MPRLISFEIEIWIWFCKPPSPNLRLNIAYFAVTEGWLLLDIGWSVLFLHCHDVRHGKQARISKWKILAHSGIRSRVLLHARQTPYPLRHEATWMLIFIGVLHCISISISCNQLHMARSRGRDTTSFRPADVHLGAYFKYTVYKTPYGGFA